LSIEVEGKVFGCRGGFYIGFWEARKGVWGGFFRGLLIFGSGNSMDRRRHGNVLFLRKDRMELGRSWEGTGLLSSCH
jgi:hypothetical protein